MARLHIFSVVLLFASFLLPPFSRRSAAESPDHLLISEVLYDAPQSGTDTQYEFLELHNPTGAPVNLAGWRVGDNAESDFVPAYVLAPGETLVVAATASGFFANYPGFSGPLVTLEGSIGDGLNNAADRLILLDPAGNAVDALSYGSDVSAFSPPCPDVPAGSSLERVSVAQDTDAAADWRAQPAPSPGAIPAAPAPTATASVTPTYTVTPSPCALHNAHGYAGDDALSDAHRDARSGAPNRNSDFNGDAHPCCLAQAAPERGHVRRTTGRQRPTVRVDRTLQRERLGR